MQLNSHVIKEEVLIRNLFMQLNRGNLLQSNMKLDWVESWVRNWWERELDKENRRIRTEDGLSGELLHSALLSSSKHLPNWNLAKLRIACRGFVLNVSRQLQLPKSLCSLDSSEPSVRIIQQHYSNSSKINSWVLWTDFFCTWTKW